MNSTGILPILITLGSPLLLGHYVLQHFIRQQQGIVVAPRPAYVSQLSFGHLTQQMQLGVVQQEGTFLARRWEGKVNVVLYHMPGRFFCELHQQADTYELLRVHACSDVAPLGKYAHNLPLGDLQKS